MAEHFSETEEERKGKKGSRQPTVFFSEIRDAEAEVEKVGQITQEYQGRESRAIQPSLGSASGSMTDRLLSVAKRQGGRARVVPRHWKVDVVGQANKWYETEWKVSIPAKKIRGIKAFEGAEPEVVKHEEIESFPLKFLEFSGATTTPEDVADAVTQSKVFQGQLSKEVKDSFYDCVRKMNEDIAWTGTQFLIPTERGGRIMPGVEDVCEGEHLARFCGVAGFKSSLEWQKMSQGRVVENPEELFKKATMGGRGGVCVRCRSKTHLAQVVEVQFRRVEVRKDEWQVFGKIVKFFMHNVGCEEKDPAEDRFRAVKDVLDNGPNWVKMEYPLEKIYRGHLDKVVNRMKEWDVTKPLPPGNKIRFQTKGVQGEVDEDTRYYAPVPSVNDWWKDLYLPVDAREDGIRQMVWMSQRMGAAREVALHGPRHEWPAPELHGFLKEKGLEDEKAAGGAFLGTSLIYAGLPKLPRGDTYGKRLKSDDSFRTVDQPWHADMQNVEVGGVSYDVMTNPGARNTTPGFSWLAPVQDTRAIDLRGDNGQPVRVEVKVGELVVWGGSADHRGLGITKEDLQTNGSLHPALHGYYENFGHPWVSDDVALNVEALRGDSVDHIGRLDGDERIEQFNVLAVRSRTLVHTVCRTKGPKDRKFKVAVEECFDEMTEDLAGMSGRVWEPCVKLREQAKVHCDAVLRRLKAEEEVATCDEAELQEMEEEVIGVLEKTLKEVQKRKLERGRRRKREETAEANAGEGEDDEGDEDDDGGGKPPAKRRKRAKVI